MTNLGVELLVLSVVLINFGAILTANIYSKSLEGHKRDRYFAENLLVILIALFDKNLVHKALGRRLESCRPGFNNPIHRQVFQPVFFIG